MNNDKLFAICLLIILMGWKVAIGQNEYAWEPKNLKGNIKSISKRTYIYEDGKKGRWDMDNHRYLFTSEMIHDYDIDFDNKGNMLSQISYKAIIRPGDSIRYQHFYEYSSNGKLKKRLAVYEGGPLKTVIHYEYDAEHKLVKIDKNKDNKYGKGHYEYQYDSNGYLVREIFYGTYGEPRNKTEYKNNNKGQKIQTVRSSYHSRKKSWIAGERSEFKYNDKNQLIELTKYLKDGRRATRNQYEYDEFGNMIIEKRFNKEDELAFTIKFDFEFDKNENWINCLVYKTVFNHDQAMYIVERQIEYRD